MAFVLVFLFVEETRLVSLEDLDFVYAVPKSTFTRFQVFDYLPWLMRRYVHYPFYRYIMRQPEQVNYCGDTEGLVPCGPPQPPQLYFKEVENGSLNTTKPEELRLDSDDDRN